MVADNKSRVGLQRLAHDELVERAKSIAQLGCAARAGLFLLEATSTAQKTSIVEHVQTARLERPVSSC